MLLSGYAINIIRPECMPGAQSLHCIARLNEDVSQALPYLNTVSGGAELIAYLVHPLIMNGLKNSFPSRIVIFSARSRKTRGFAEAYWTYAAQKNPPLDAEIAKKGHLWMETI